MRRTVPKCPLLLGPDLPPQQVTGNRVAVVWRADGAIDGSGIVGLLQEAGYHTVEHSEIDTATEQVRSEDAQVFVAIRSSSRPTDRERELRRSLAAQRPDVCVLEGGSYRTQLAGRWHIDRNKPLILVAEHDVRARSMFVAVLRGCGYHTMAVENGKQVISMLANYGADLLIIDVPVPGGLRRQPIHIAKQVLPSLRVIAVVAFPVDGPDRPMVAEADATLVQPVRPQQLASAVMGLL